MDELFEVLTLVQTNKISKVPIILVGEHYWSGLKDWIREVMLAEANNISEEDLDLMPITDGINDILKHLKRWMKPQKRHVDSTMYPGAKARVIPQPLGVVGIGLMAMALLYRFLPPTPGSADPHTAPSTESIAARAAT